MKKTVLMLIALLLALNPIYSQEESIVDDTLNALNIQNENEENINKEPDVEDAAHSNLLLYPYMTANRDESPDENSEEYEDPDVQAIQWVSEQYYSTVTDEELEEYSEHHKEEEAQGGNG